MYPVHLQYRRVGCHGHISLYSSLAKKTKMILKPLYGNMILCLLRHLLSNKPIKTHHVIVSKNTFQKKCLTVHGTPVPGVPWTLQWGAMDTPVVDQYIVHIDGRKETSWTLDHWSSHQQAVVETPFESDNLLQQNWELLSQVRKSQIFFHTEC